MNRKVITAAACAIILLLSGCGGSTTPTQTGNLHSGSASSASDKTASVPASRTTSLVYYKAADDALHIIPVTMSVQASDHTPLQAVKEMIKGDRHSRYPLLPAGLDVKSVNVKDGTATVDFSKEINKLKGETSESLFIKMTTDTLTEFSDIKKVVFRAEGKTPQFQMDMTKAYKRDTTIVQK